MSNQSRFFHLAGKRTSAIAVFTTVIAATASILTATPASAFVAHTVSTLSSTGVNQPVPIPAASVTAHVSVPFTIDSAFSAGDTIPQIDYAIIGGSTPSAPLPNVTACTVTTAPTVGHTAGVATCDITDTTGAAGTDTIEAFADNDASATLSAADKTAAPVLVTFSGPPSAVTLTPATTRTTTGTCVLYTMRATDALGQPAASRPFTIVVTETSTTPPGRIFFYNFPPSTPADCQTQVGGSGVMSNPITATNPGVPTGADGTITFGVSANTPGTGTVKVTSDDVLTVSNSSTATWTAGGADSVTNLTIAAPTSVTQYTGTSAAYQVTATDHDGDPVQGVTVNAESDLFDPDSPSNPCGTTNQLGQVTCTVTNGGSAGTDTLTFWVDYDLVTDNVGVPDSNEPQARATAIFRNAPTVAVKTLTCIDQLAADHGLPASTCTVPTAQHSVVFTQTLVDSNGKPIVGAVVELHATSATLAGVTATVPDQFATSDATGVATFTINDPNPANADSVDVSSFLGTTLLNSAEADWQTVHATSLTLTPPLQSVTKGSQVSVLAQVSDQFGAPWTAPDAITYNVAGPDGGVTGVNVATNATGSLQITYPSSAIAVGEDTIFASDASAPALTGQAAVEFLTGSPTASMVTVDTTGNGTATTCPSTGTPQNTNLVLGVSNTPVCALVKNAGGEVLAGKSVTFTVDIGQVAGTTPVPVQSTKTYVATTNKSGIATAVVASTKIGTQTVTAAADSASGTGTLTYAAPTSDRARNIVISPASASIIAGGQQKFIWTVTDQYGNPVAGATIDYLQGGVSLAGATSSGTLITGPDGTASVAITTISTDSGAGSITGTLRQPAPPSPLNQCGRSAGDPATATTDGNCSAAATYTVLGSSLPTSIALKVTHGVTPGHQETVVATVKNADGSPAANQVVRFLVTGVNGAIGSAQTNSAGVATVTYLASHAGVDIITVFDDINNDQVQEGNEPGHRVKAIITGVTDKPTIHLTTSNGSVTIHVITHPKMPRVKVAYYVFRYGAFHRIGTSVAGLQGRASGTFFFPKGVTRRFKARTASQHGIKGAKTVSKKITIK